MAAIVSDSSHSISEKWFDDFVGTIRSHQLMLNTNTANPDLKAFYDDILSGNIERLIMTNRETSQQFYVRRILVEYLEMIKHLPFLKLAVDHNNSEVLVWAEVGNDDADTEHQLLKAEAMINSKFHDFGFDMESTIVEEGDEFPIPNHYQVLKD